MQYRLACSLSFTLEYLLVHNPVTFAVGGGKVFAVEVLRAFVLWRYKLFIFLPKTFCLASCLLPLFSPDTHAVSTAVSLLHVGKVFPVLGTRQRPHAGWRLALFLCLLLARRSLDRWFSSSVHLFPLMKYWCSFKCQKTTLIIWKVL